MGGSPFSRRSEAFLRFGDKRVIHSGDDTDGAQSARGVDLMDNRQRDRSLYVVQSVVRRERFDFDSPHVAFVPRQRNLPVVALDSNRQEKNRPTPLIATIISPLLRSSIRPFITLFVSRFTRPLYHEKHSIRSLRSRRNVKSNTHRTNHLIRKVSYSSTFSSMHQAITT